MKDDKCGIPRRIWRLLYPVLLCMAVQVVATITIFWGTDTFFVISTVLMCAVFVPMWLVTQKKLEPYHIRRFGLCVALTFVLFTALNLALESILSLIDVKSIYPTYEPVNAIITDMSLPIAVIFGSVLTPIAEECCVRGLILNRALRWTPKWVAAVVSAALFGVMHFNLLQGFYAFVVGVLLAWVFVKFRSLWLPIVGHLAFNLSGFGLAGIARLLGAETETTEIVVATLPEVLPYLLPSAVIAAAALWGLMRQEPAVLIQPQDTEQSTESSD